MLNTWVLNNYKLLPLQTINCQNNVFTALGLEKVGSLWSADSLRESQRRTLCPILFYLDVYSLEFTSQLKACPSALLKK